MRKVIGFLFPWRATFKRLELEKQWWHRLAVVVFFVALLPTLLYSWVFADDACSPVKSYESEIHEWGGQNPNGVLLDFSSMQPLDSNAPPVQLPPIVQKTIEMPDGTTVKYPGTTPDETINAEWKHKRSIAEAKAMIFGFCWAVLATVLFSYLLQAAYRALVYVIYGAKARATPDSPVAG
jgi:hypothetical protein